MNWAPLELSNLTGDELVAHLTLAVNQRDAIIKQLRYNAESMGAATDERLRSKSAYISQLLARIAKLRYRNDGHVEADLRKEIDHRNFVIQTLLDYISDTPTNNHHQRRAIIDALRS